MNTNPLLPSITRTDIISISPEQQAKQLTVIGTFVPTRETEELEKLSKLLESLLDIRASSDSMLKKAKLTMQAVARISVIRPVLSEIAKLVKLHGWDNRSRSNRVLIWSSAAAATIFGGQAAGIAALGTAISVPLWIVFGSGAMFAEMIASQIAGELEARRKAERAREGVIDGMFTVLG